MNLKPLHLRSQVGKLRHHLPPSAVVKQYDKPHVVAETAQINDLSLAVQFVNNMLPHTKLHGFLGKIFVTEGRLLCSNLGFTDIRFLDSAFFADKVAALVDFGVKFFGNRRQKSRRRHGNATAEAPSLIGVRQFQRVHCSCYAHVQKPPLFFYFAGIVEVLPRRQNAVFASDNKDALEFESFAQ